MKQIANAYLYTDLSTVDLKYWADQLDKNIYTPVGLALLATQTDLFKNQNLPLATMYYVAYGVFPSVKNMMLWKTILDTGASLSDIGAAFVNSVEFNAKYPTAVLSISSKLDAVIKASGVSVANDVKANGLAQLSKGTIGWGDVLHYLADASAKQMPVTLSLLSTAVSGVVPTSAEVTTLGTVITTAFSSIYTKYPIGMTTAYVGTSQSDIYYALESGGTIRTLEGNDTVYCNIGTDKIIFESTPVANGMDTVYNFTIGEKKDILDFSKFLNVVNTSHIATVKGISITEAAWDNGDVLVASGYALTNATNIAALFGSKKAYAAPTGTSKVVLITADIIGNASIWYIINQTDGTKITADEVYQVGSVNEINNLTLVGIDATNLVESLL
ncbi:MAG: hypothetical protein NTZ60_00040 [Campylobacterales bacterium]|nr:hypothetical protein [Campylobacterales bacterium]